jgi:hypothetical protein
VLPVFPQIHSAARGKEKFNARHRAGWLSARNPASR